MLSVWFFIWVCTKPKKQYFKPTQTPLLQALCALCACHNVSGKAETDQYKTALHYGGPEVKSQNAMTKLKTQ